MSLEMEPVIAEGGMTAEAGGPAASATAEGRDTIAADVDRQRDESFLVRVLLNEDHSIHSTSIRHVRTGAERRFPGWKPQELPDFITAIYSDSPVQADLKRGATPPVPPGISEADDSGQPVLQARFVCTGLSIDHHVLRAGEQFTATFTLDLAEPPAGMEQFPYRAFITAKPMATGSDRVIAQAEGLLAASSPVIRIEAEGLAPGAYRLDGAVSLLEPGTDRPVDVAAPAESLAVRVVD